MQIMLQLLTWWHITWIKPNKSADSFIFDFVVLYFGWFYIFIDNVSSWSWGLMQHVTGHMGLTMLTLSHCHPGHVPPVREPRHNWHSCETEITQESEHLRVKTRRLLAPLTLCTRDQGPWCQPIRALIVQTTPPLSTLTFIRHMNMWWCYVV